MEKKTLIDQKLAATLVHKLSESFYQSGVFSDDDIKDMTSLRSAFKRLTSSEDWLQGVIIDHTGDLIRHARSFRKKKDYGLSRMLYATFFEHQVNQLIHLYCVRGGLDYSTQTDIIRSVNFEGKFTWLLKLMQYPTFHSDHLKTIKVLGASRNEFIHYKWKPMPGFDKVPDLEKEESAIEVEFKKIDAAVKYFKGYFSKVGFKGSRRRIRNVLKNK